MKPQSLSYIACEANGRFQSALNLDHAALALGGSEPSTTDAALRTNVGSREVLLQLLGMTWLDLRTNLTDHAPMAQKSGYQQFCPIALTSEILCNRWTTLILRAFFCGATTFSDVQKSAPHMSSAILANRLKQLEQAGILARSCGRTSSKTDYALTEAGHALFPILDQMGIWAQDWLRRDIVAEENLDPDVLFWELRQLSILRKTHPKTRRVASFLLSGVPSKKQRYWIVFEPNDTEICVKDLGHDVDILVSGHIRALVEVWLGHISLDAAIEQSSVTLDGSTSEIKAFSSWFMLSHFSKVGLETTPKT